MRILPASLGRSFNGLWFGTGAANLGDGMALFALPLLALAVGASPGGVAAVTTALTLAWPLFGLHAGWIVDRVDRRALLTGVNLARAALLAGLTAAHLAGVLSLPLIIAAAVLLGVAETLVDTALTSTIPRVVPPTARGRANARVEATINVTNQLAGPPLAGLLAATTLALATGASAVLYVLAVAGILVMTLSPVPAGAGTPHPDRPRDGLVAGLRYLWRQPVVRTLTLYTAVMNVVWAAATALLVVYAVAPGPLGLTTTQYGLLLTAMAVGGLVASAVVEPLRRRFGVTTLLIADAAGTVLLVLPVAVDAPAWAVAAGAVVAGAGSSIWRILVATIRQNLSPPELLGRVYAASRVLSWGVLPPGAALAGVIAELWGVRAAFVLATVLALVVMAAFIRYALRTDLSAAVEAPDETVAAH
ncbi:MULTISPECIES: MFS transporter [Nonomuraea]|uniref:MFS transporter n=1 Tax=Nonomuraea ferruginea TaxID=46174 RepID=A0ABT4SYC9_9ACTN|nr:MFS transporter [Nonomuraea ferruginea]MDA0642003.1 MFS transporter [Nonomuraea ferruginea]